MNQYASRAIGVVCHKNVYPTIRLRLATLLGSIAIQHVAS